MFLPVKSQNSSLYSLEEHRRQMYRCFALTSRPGSLFQPSRGMAKHRSEGSLQNAGDEGAPPCPTCCQHHSVLLLQSPAMAWAGLLAMFPLHPCHVNVPRVINAFMEALA